MSRVRSSIGAAVIVIFGRLAAPQAPAAAASAKVWLGRAAEYEDFLRNAAVVWTEDLPVGVTRPIRCHFAPGGLVESMAFKSIPPGLRAGFWESYKSEMAAYELDKLLDLEMIPPTVEKRVRNTLGAAVMGVSPVRSFKQMGGPPTPPPAHADSWSRQLSRAKMFDNLIANRDPNLGNWLVWREHRRGAERGAAADGGSRGRAASILGRAAHREAVARRPVDVVSRSASAWSQSPSALPGRPMACRRS